MLLYRLRIVGYTNTNIHLHTNGFIKLQHFHFIWKWPITWPLKISLQKDVLNKKCLISFKEGIVLEEIFIIIIEYIIASIRKNNFYIFFICYVSRDKNENISNWFHRSTISHYFLISYWNMYVFTFALASIWLYSWCCYYVIIRNNIGNYILRKYRKVNTAVLRYKLVWALWVVFATTNTQLNTSL